MSRLGGPLLDRLLIAPEVSAALRAGAPVVALESTLITHGLPHPLNFEVAREAEHAVRVEGAVPATVAIRDGRLMVGLSEEELVALASAMVDTLGKAARPNLAAALAAPGWAGATVSATMIAAHVAGITVFATGGIGGVHHGALAGRAPTFDISPDLEELARTAMAVVSAGPKAILDVRATIEYLETRGVPVVTIGQEDVPGFFSRASDVRSPLSVADVEAAARLTRHHLDLALGAGILLCVPVPESEALSPEVAQSAIERAVAEAEGERISGPRLTPWLLTRVAQLSEGASVRANRALIVNNARVAGQLAARLQGVNAR